MLQSTSLQFPIRDQRRVQQPKLVVALLDGHGDIVAAKEGTVDFAMADAAYAHLLASGINAVLNLDVPPGEYRLRAVGAGIGWRQDGELPSKYRSEVM